MRLPQDQNPKNAFHKMQLDFLNERTYVSLNLNQYFKSHFITSGFNTTVTLKTGLIFFIDTTRNKNFRQYINENFNLIDQLIDSKNRNFVYNKDLKIDDTHIWFANYYYPFLNERIEQKNGKSTTIYKSWKGLGVKRLSQYIFYYSVFSLSRNREYANASKKYYASIIGNQPNTIFTYIKDDFIIQKTNTSFMKYKLYETNTNKRKMVFRPSKCSVFRE